MLLQQVLPSSLLSSKELTSSLSAPPCLPSPQMPHAARGHLSYPFLTSTLQIIFPVGSQMLEQENLDSAESNFLEEYYIAFFVKCRFRQSRFVLNLDQIKERVSSVPDQFGKQSWGLHAGAKGRPVTKLPVQLFLPGSLPASCNQCLCPLSRGTCPGPMPSCGGWLCVQGLHNSHSHCLLKQGVQRKPCLPRNPSGTSQYWGFSPPLATLQAGTALSA